MFVAKLLKGLTLAFSPLNIYSALINQGLFIQDCSSDRELYVDKLQLVPANRADLDLLAPPN
jgi:hypothetical protein